MGLDLCASYWLDIGSDGMHGEFHLLWGGLSADASVPPWGGGGGDEGEEAESEEGKDCLHGHVRLHMSSGLSPIAKEVVRVFVCARAWV